MFFHLFYSCPHREFHFFRILFNVSFAIVSPKETEGAGPEIETKLTKPEPKLPFQGQSLLLAARITLNDADAVPPRSSPDRRSAPSRQAERVVCQAPPRSGRALARLWRRASGAQPFQKFHQIRVQAPAPFAERRADGGQRTNRVQQGLRVPRQGRFRQGLVDRQGLVGESGPGRCSFLAASRCAPERVRAHPAPSAARPSPWSPRASAPAAPQRAGALCASLDGLGRALVCKRPVSLAETANRR